MKMLAARLKVAAQEIIHLDQTGFLSGRFIGENVNELFSLIDHSYKYQILAFLMSIDFEKAVDKVNWDALYRIMEGFNICLKYQKVVSILYKDVVGNVINNGFWSPPW